MMIHTALFIMQSIRKYLQTAHFLHAFDRCIQPTIRIFKLRIQQSKLKQSIAFEKSPIALFVMRSERHIQIHPMSLHGFHKQGFLFFAPKLRFANALITLQPVGNSNPTIQFTPRILDVVRPISA
ncbi:hypothetical protein D1872_254870 [compost metagenome]